MTTALRSEPQPEPGPEGELQPAHDPESEPQQHLTDDEARRHVGIVHSSLEAAQESIEVLSNARAWTQLGYSSWSALCEAEFQPQLNRIERARRARELSAAGMSDRAIGDALRTSPRTVARDRAGAALAAPDGTDPAERRDASETPSDPVPRNVDGRDGKKYTVKPPPDLDPASRTAGVSKAKQPEGRLVPGTDRRRYDLYGPTNKSARPTFRYAETINRLEDAVGELIRTFDEVEPEDWYEAAGYDFRRIGEELDRLDEDVRRAFSRLHLNIRCSTDKGYPVGWSVALWDVEPSFLAEDNE